MESTPNEERIKLLERYTEKALHDREIQVLSFGAGNADVLEVVQNIINILRLRFPELDEIDNKFAHFLDILGGRVYHRLSILRKTMD